MPTWLIEVGPFSENTYPGRISTDEVEWYSYPHHPDFVVLSDPDITIVPLLRAAFDGSGGAP